MWSQVPPLDELPLGEQALVGPLGTIDMLQATPGAETLNIPVSELAPGEELILPRSQSYLEGQAYLSWGSEHMLVMRSREIVCVDTRRGMVGCYRACDRYRQLHVLMERPVSLLALRFLIRWATYVVGCG